MSRLKELVQSHFHTADKEPCITPGPDLPWQPVGPGKQHLLVEVEKLYWEGVEREINNIIRTLEVWESDDLFRAASEPKLDVDLGGYEDFIENVSKPAREYAAVYGAYLSTRNPPVTFIIPPIRRPKTKSSHAHIR